MALQAAVLEEVLRVEVLGVVLQAGLRGKLWGEEGLWGDLQEEDLSGVLAAEEDLTF